MPFVKGQSGNPSGRPAIPKEIKEMLYKSTPKALSLLIETITDESKPYNLRIDCAKTILDRAYGKAAQAVSVDASVGATITTSTMTADEMLAAIREASLVIGGAPGADDGGKPREGG